MKLKRNFLIGSVLALSSGCSSVPLEPTGDPAVEASPNAAASDSKDATVRTSVGEAVDPKAAREMLQNVSNQLAANEGPQDLESVLTEIHATTDGFTRGRLIADYMAIAERLSPSERELATRKLSDSFQAKTGAAL